MNPRSSIHSQLAVAGHRQDRAVRIATALTVIALLVLLLLGVAFLDYGVLLPAPARWAAFVVMVILLIAGGVLLARLWRRPTSLKQSALEVESARPESGCEVSTAAEYLTGERTISQEYEQELVAALQQRAADTVAQNPLSHHRRLMLPGLAALGVLVALGVFVAAYPSAGTALQRTAAPWTRAAFSQVTVSPGAVEVPVGRALEITGRFTGRQPERAELQLREDGQKEWTTRPLTATTNGVFRHTVATVNSSFTYRVAGLDALSDEFQVTSYVPPQVKEIRVRLEPPTYTGLKPVEQASADITMVRGTRATFRVLPTVSLSKAQLRFTNGVILELKADASQQWSAQLPVNQDAEFRFELLDAKGRRGGDEQVHHLTAVPDAPPKVDFALPGQDIRAAATNRIDLKLTASDDFGVAGVKIFYHRLGAPEKELTAIRTAGKGTDVQSQATLDLALLGLKEFELVAYHAEARDNNTLDGPGVGRSPTYFIEITDLESGQCLSQCKGQKVNLLVIQKQIIADTTALAANAPAGKFMELAGRQQDAIEFGRMYQQALAQTGAPATAQSAMKSAMGSMEKAAMALWSRTRDVALPPEESALASLYQVVGLMPQLENLPTTPPPLSQNAPQPPPAVKVVLEAIRKQKKEPVNRQEVARLLEQVQQLSRQQSGLNSAAQKPGAAPGEGAGEGPGKGNGKGKGPGNGPAEGAPKPGAPSTPPESKDLAKLAPQQEKLGKEAQELAERIARQAGKGSRLGHGAGQRVGEAAAKMGQAAQSMRSGKGEAAGTAGDQSEASLGAAAALLEDLLSGRPELSDVSAEDAPKQYEAAIADYFKRLSHAE